MRPAAAAALLALLLLPAPAWGSHGGVAQLDLPAPTVVHALAVAQTSRGFVGSVSTISIIAAPHGSGHVFVDTSPLAQVDMQGSARIAVRVASAVAGVPLQEHDFFVVVRSDAPVIGGPSAGAVMTVGTIAAMRGWAVNQSVMMTGTVNPDGDIGPIGGLLEKIEAAARAGATLFLFPEGQEQAAPLSDGGFRPLPVVVMDHCARLAVACRPVGHVEEAVRLMTGHAFEPRQGPGDVTSADFQAVMRPLASNLTAQAHQLVSDATRRLGSATGLPSSVRAELKTMLDGAAGSVFQADTAYAEERYYTASSRSYQASVAARTATYLVGLFEATDRDRYVRDLVADAEDRAKAAMASAAQEVRGRAHLEGVGAAQERASEAERAAEASRVLYQQGDAQRALAQAAQARERSASVAWWLDIASRAAGQEDPLGREVLNRTARDLIDTARETIVYAQVLLEEGGSSPQLLSGASDFLERAEADHARGFLPASIFEAIQAEVRASAALELAGSGQQVQDAKLQRARTGAGAAIAEAREAGPEPILAQSYFEFAGDLQEPEDALAYYNSARSVALLGRSFFAAEAEARPSRFVGFAEVPEAQRGGVLGSTLGLAALGAAFLLGGMLGAAFAGVVALAVRKPARAAPPPQPLAPAPPPEAGVDPFLGLGPEAPPPPPRPRDEGPGWR